MSEMRISTIIPAYNRADVISETLNSILSQTRPPCEVIVVDDGSTDGTCEVVTEFGKAVTLIRQSNSGAGSARNAGFAHANGEIIHFMDSDDLSALENYAVAAAAIEHGAEMTYGPWLKTRFQGRLLAPEPVAVQQKALPTGCPPDVRVLLSGWITVFQSCMFRRSLIESAGPYRCDLKTSEDTELLYRILLRTRSIQHVPECLTLYRVHPENQISEQNLQGRLIDQANLLAIFENHLLARTDLDAAAKRTFQIRKHSIAREMSSYDPVRAHELDADVTTLNKALYRLDRLTRRFSRKLRVMNNGNYYTSAFGAAPLRPDQREQIARLGFDLPPAGRS